MINDKQTSIVRWDAIFVSAYHDAVVLYHGTA